MELIVKQFENLTTHELHDLLQARVSVFVVEQQCPYQEVDGKDLYSYHVYYKDNGRIQAYARVVPAKESGEMVTIGRVLSVKRGCGLGKKIVQEGIRVAKEVLQANTIRIEAQSYAKGFYERSGFKQTSEEFLEDGIPHITMTLSL